MKEQKNVFTEMNGNIKGNESFQQDGADYSNFSEFKKLIHARRSVRKFTDEKIPDEIVEECLDLGLLAPNSSNLQTWKFYRIVDIEAKKRIAYACFSQPAATSASELIVCVAKPSSWRAHAKQMLDEFSRLPVETPKSAVVYYSKIAPFVYTTGPLNVLTPFKWLINTTLGIFRVVPREPISSISLKLWSVKSCALACENIMLAFRAAGFDTCPMEGYDSKKVKSILGLDGSESIVMIIGAGKRAPGGIYGPRIRFDREQFIKKI